jgi:hypothetical protein
VFSTAALLILTAGYPYYIVYTPFLLVPYLLVLLVPPLRRVWLTTADEAATGPLLLLAVLSGATLIPAALTSPWLLKMKALMSETVDRGTPNFDYATARVFGPLDSLGSWIFPPLSQFEGWYYFGMFATLAIVCYLLDGALRLGTNHRDRSLQAGLLSFLAFVTYFTWGRRSALFVFVWHHTPVLNQLRVWGRMNVILVPVVALLLALALEHLQQLLPLWGDTRLASRPRWRIALALQLLLCAAILALQVRMAVVNQVGNYWTSYFHPVRLRYFASMTVVAAGALAIIALLGRRLETASFRAVCLTTAAIVSSGDLYILSSRQWSTWNEQPPIESRRAFDVLGVLAAQFSRPRDVAALTPMSWDRQLSGLGIYENWGFKRYADVYHRYFDRTGKPRPDVDPRTVKAAMRFYGADRRGKRVFLSHSIDHSEPAEFLADVDRTAVRIHPEYRVLLFDGDSLRLRVSAQEPVWLSYIDNWDPDWQARINGQRVHIVRLFGSFKSVLVPAGRSEVVFTYRPW